MPKNLEYIYKWCELNRPDLIPMIKAVEKDNGFILLLTTGFEAGRLFQKENPNSKDGPSAY